MKYAGGGRWVGGSSLRRPQEHFEPARAAVDTLPAVLRPPSLGKAETDCVRVEGSVVQQGISYPGVMLCHGPREYLECVTRRNLEHAECPRVGQVEGGRVDKERHLGPVVDPDPGVIATDDQT